jgi:Flp pilus assembly protein TadG
MERTSSQRNHPEAGAAIVEFALLIPVLMLILFGIINLGVMLYNQAVITNAAREGARWAVIHATSSYGNTCTNSYSSSPVDPCQVAYSYASPLIISFSGSGLTASNSAANYTLGTPQSVTVTYTYKGIGYYFGSQANKQYTSTSIMLHE